MPSCLSAYLSPSTHNTNDYEPLPMASGTLAFGHELLVRLSGVDEPVNLVLHDNEDSKQGLGCLTIIRRRTGAIHRVASSLNITKASASSIRRISYIQILDASLTTIGTTKHVTIKAIVAKKNQRDPKHRLWTLEGDVHELGLGQHPHSPTSASATTNGGDGHLETSGKCPVETFCQELMSRAYPDGVKAHRRLRVIVNPHGGKGQAKSICNEQILPIFKAAGCVTKVEYTGPPDSPTDATVLGREHDYQSFDALVTVSGDGISYQIVNGLASRPDARIALRETCLVPIPAGSGNALNINVVGTDRVNDPVWSALVAVKGRKTSMDLCSFVQGGKRSVSFLSQAMGLMADLDLETEHLRWMGDARFTFGYIQGCLKRRTYAFELALKISGPTDKKLMAQRYNDLISNPPDPIPTHAEEFEGEGLPPLKFGTDLEPLPSEAKERVHQDIPSNLEQGWHTLQSRCLWAYGGKFPFISADVKLFVPACPSPSDGLIDLAIVPPLSPLQALQSMDGASTGATFWSDTMRYYKVEAYRCTMLNPTGNIAIDGEEVPYETFQVECHRGLGSVMTLNGRFETMQRIEVPIKK